MADLLPVAFRGDTLYLLEHNGEPFAPSAPAPVFLVYCTADVFNRLQGRYAAQLTVNGAIIAHRIERAARYASQQSALDVSRRLASKFNGTAWAAVSLVDMEVSRG